MNLFSLQPAGAAPAEHRTPSEGGGRQQAGQADALQVGDDIHSSICDVCPHWIVATGHTHWNGSHKKNANMISIKVFVMFTQSTLDSGHTHLHRSDKKDATI